MTDIQFIDENKSKAKIKVVGVGGGGGNAINAMLKASLDGEIGFYAVNTDAQALARMASLCECVQIGIQLTKCLGVGADHELARKVAEQDRERLEEIVNDADMVFIAAGMGGGTGTGAAPVIAEICRERGILTVAVVTKPFSWEKRDKNADIGIDKLSKSTDSIIIVPNDRIMEVHGDDISIHESFQLSDDILRDAVAGICEIIYKSGRVNVDFADVRTVMSEMGKAMMGTAKETGIDRAVRAAQAVIACPLLEGIELKNARGLLVNITVNDKSFKLSELNEIMRIIGETASDDAKVFFGLVDNPDIEEEVRITLVATGLYSAMDLSKTRSSGRWEKAPSPAIVRTNRKPRKFTNISNNQGILLDDKQIPTMLRKQHN